MKMGLGLRKAENCLVSNEDGRRKKGMLKYGRWSVRVRDRRLKLWMKVVWG